ncbi:hypothetical protein T440DRAFT_393981 [Plenodomus tracheiphilus IPT5]|uniref:F-box domain-containing protein n=1 Tax=Plenodomus tracheiphilus IPT5 TaxID=1408161 RepID=A0A6A7BBN0_9PLEO|nr:hypothetical protein T440DRAFT_393981 [Plenodomus tracheiphilus IPT5]
MTISLDRLPYDILFQVASSLPLEEIVNLSQTCRQLSILLDERTLCRRTVEEQHSYTIEAEKARSGKITYKQACLAIYDRRHAISSAYPFSARVAGYGNTFLYLQGTLCVLNGNTVEVSGVHPRSDPVQLNLVDIIRSILGNAGAGDFNVSLLYYSDSILAVHVTEPKQSDGSYIFAINTTAVPPNGRRVERAMQIASSSKLFVRHTSRYLYYGTHTGVGDDGHHKWEIDGVSLNPNFPLPRRVRPLLLEEFHGTDIGSTVAFEIHNDFFYAVSNQGTFEVEEIDYTSFYHTIRFPISDPQAEKIEANDRLYRRQHQEGPIHDSWTDLTLQLDERTNETVIVESRREWAQASSRQSRTFYVTKLKLNEQNDSLNDNPMDDDSDSAPQLPDDILTTLLDSTDKCHYMLTPPQHSSSQHAEFPPSDPTPRSFILARTKFRAYSYNSTSFLDIVEDDRCCPDNNNTDPFKQPCLRLRIGSRREYVPQSYSSLTTTGSEMDSASMDKGKQRADIQDAPFESDFVDKTRYKYAPVRMWPPPKRCCPCARRLHGILSPSLPGAGGVAGARSVVGVLDERSLVYMVKAGRGYGVGDGGVGAVVVVEFCRGDGVSASLRGNGLSAGAASCSNAMAIATGDALEHVDGSSSTDLETWQWTPGHERRCQAGDCH